MDGWDDGPRRMGRWSTMDGTMVHDRRIRWMDGTMVHTMRRGCQAMANDRQRAVYPMSVEGGRDDGKPLEGSRRAHNLLKL